MSNSDDKERRYYQELSQENDRLIEEIRSLREKSVGEKTILDAFDWSLTKKISGRSVYYTIYDKVSGTNVSITYYEDAHVLREMLKVMRLDNIQHDKERRLLDSQGIFN
ncbi:MAG: hypothetical protein DRH89_07320 [Candidatus Cloacimonadota bacterium]|jgi:hypothetical protein|nr:MAG: hypothetical protein DRH89_07320 [Candidatus Cloacimonadota bacterium]